MEERFEYSLEEALRILFGKVKTKTAEEVNYKKTVREIYAMIGSNDSDLENFLEGKTVKEFIEQNPYSNI